jgi:CDP-diacylglycerol--glycerol-3-phosphate 3-phosphatidyltransferase
MNPQARGWQVRVPWMLVGFRLALAPLFPLGGWLGAPGWFFVAVLVAGIVSDIYDGVLARRWGTSTPPLRRADGNVDTVFYSSAGLTAAVLHRGEVAPWLWPLAIMFAFMVAQNVVNIVKYGRQPSYHMYSGKMWGIALVVALGCVFLSGPLDWSMEIMIALAIYNSSEDIIASLVLPEPMTDIPTMFHAVAIARTMRRKS